jgi:ABC-type lipoprotein release transport system permease subunit
MVARCEMRRRRGSLLLLTLLVGVIGAVVLAVAAGARRSDSSLARFNAYSRSADVELYIKDPTPAQLRALRHAPSIRDVAELYGFAVQSDRFPDLAIAGAVDERFGRTVDRPELVAGRLANPGRADEITIGEGLQAQQHLRVGDRITLSSFTPEQIATYEAGGNGGPAAGPTTRLRIVGIVRRPLDLGDRAATGGVTVMTPAFTGRYRDDIGTFIGSVLRIRARHGAAGVPEVLATVRSVFGRSAGFNLQSLAIESQGAQDAINVLTVALWIFAGVAALAGTVAVVIILSRELVILNADQPTLRALGLNKRQRILLSAPLGALVASGGALLACVGAIALSPLFPIGVASRADPDVGLHADWTVLVVGAAALVAVVLAITAAVALRVTWQASHPDVPAARARTSRLADIATAFGLAPSATTGLRMAFQPGQWPRSVPVRSALLGAVVGVLGVTSLSVFAANVHTLRVTPARYGWTWDFAVEDQSGNAACVLQHPALEQVPGVGALASVCTQSVQLDGSPVSAWGIARLRGSIRPAIVAGRAPRNRGEVALGAVTLDRLGKRIGDHVRGRGPNGAVTYLIVGRMVLPIMSESQPLADGALLTARGFDRVFDPSSNQTGYYLGRFSPGADRAAVARRISTDRSLTGFTGPMVSVEVGRLGEIDWFPLTLAALLTSLALLAVGHALVTSVRRRRHDLAVLKTLGFERRQVRAAVAWEATALAVVGVLVGLPIGVVVGGRAWMLLADDLGVASSWSVPAWAVVGVVAGALVLVNAVAWFPARAAARTRPAIALRAE